MLRGAGAMAHVEVVIMPHDRDSRGVVAGNTAGMFWRFLVADDANVDRFIVRDSDSRLGLRERLAVREWEASPYAVHTMRDHPNHNRPLNGGLWGGTRRVRELLRGVTMLSRIQSFSARNPHALDRYSSDLTFLGRELWPLLRPDQIAHDSYTCERYPNSWPFPSRRGADFEHVGAVYDEWDQPRLSDVCPTLRACMLGRPVPMRCRRRPEFLYG